jgi:hypothetical protein
MFLVRSGVIPTLALAGLVTWLAAAVRAEEPAPAGWFTAGSHPGDYAMTIDRAEKHGGAASATIRCTADPPAEGFGTLMQQCGAKPYGGKRLRVTGYAKSKDVEGWAGLWVRVDGLEKTSLAFDNMMKRPIKGSTEWTKYTIVLDVPEDAAVIAFGVLMGGKGQVWIDDLKFEAVGQDVEATGLEVAPQDFPAADREKLRESIEALPKEPRNLDFEK